MSYKIRYIKEHLILDVDEGLWVLDTGAPASFGSVAKLEIHDQCYDITSNYMGFDNEKLSETLGENIEGLVNLVQVARDLSFDSVFTINIVLTISINCFLETCILLASKKTYTIKFG